MIDSLSHSEAALFDFEVVPVEAIALELDLISYSDYATPKFLDLAM